MKYLVQPYFSDPASDTSYLKIYKLNADGSAGAAIATITLEDSALNYGQPNDVLIYNNPQAPDIYVFVSVLFGTPTNPLPGQILVYAFADVNALASWTDSTVPAIIQNNLGNVAMAIQPGTGDLYVAASTLYGTDPTTGQTVQISGDGGIVVYTNASNYTQAGFVQFTDYNYDESAAASCANLAFDLHGNLWMTTFDDGGQYLTCFTDPGPANPTVPYSSSNEPAFFQIGNGAQTVQPQTLSGTATSGLLYALAQPEGIAFDPLGNLWLANNCQSGVNGNGNGTLLMIPSSLLKSWYQNRTNFVAGQPIPIDGTTTGLVAYYQENAQFGGLLFDGFTLYANDQGNKVVWQIALAPSAADPSILQPSSVQASGIPTTFPGNGGMAIFDTAPASLLVKDWTNDPGGDVPDVLPSGVCAWESPDIGVTNQPITSATGTTSFPLPAGLTDLSSDGEIGFSGSAYAYVLVTNTGSASTEGTEVVKLYWAASSAGLGWPQPWDGLEVQTNNNLSTGGLIGAQLLGTLETGGQKIFQFEWTNVPDPREYSGHFCLLARIETGSLTPFGMSFPEQTDIFAETGETGLIANTTNNSQIAWRNITIVDSNVKKGPHKKGPHMIPLRLQILGANYTPREKPVRFAIETLDRASRSADIASKVVLSAEGTALRHILDAKPAERVAQYLGDGKFHLRDIARGIGDIRLRAGETLPFELEFTPREGIEDFAVRVIQYVDADGEAKLVGGQTFVVGKVRGFATR